MIFLIKREESDVIVLCVDDLIISKKTFVEIQKTVNVLDTKRGRCLSDKIALCFKRSYPMSFIFLLLNNKLRLMATLRHKNEEHCKFYK